VTIAVRALQFALVTFLWWCVGTLGIFATAFACGLGPDASCSDPNIFFLAVAAVSVVVGYGAIVILLIRYWSR
jgi:hypothetical protein